MPDQGGQLELRLQTVLGAFLMFTRGEAEEARLAILRGLELADRLGDAGYRAILWDGSVRLYMRRGGLREGWEITYGDSVAFGLSRRIRSQILFGRAVSLHILPGTTTRRSHTVRSCWDTRLFQGACPRMDDINSLHGRFFQRLSKTLAIEHRTVLCRA